MAENWDSYRERVMAELETLCDKIDREAEIARQRDDAADQRMAAVESRLWMIVGTIVAAGMAAALKLLYDVAIHHT